ncbi:MAG: hypothetical protein WB683_11665 [Candidatus Sulfotelmatobacter sp.]
MDDLKKRRFVLGVVLAWVPWLPIPFGVLSAFRVLSEQRATGLGVVAGGLTEKFVLLGISATLISEVAATVLLFRAFSAGHWVRGLFSVLSICLSGLTLLLIFFFVWLTRLHIHSAS